MLAEKTIVIGLDGAHFELIQPWIDQGKLPTIESIIETGVSSDLESVYPPVTSPNWKSYTTGMNPAKFGIFWWENIDINNRRVHYPDERKNEQPEFWERLEKKHSTGIIGIPTTYPPKETDTPVVAGAPDGKNTGFAHPPELEEKLVNKLNYRVTKNQKFKTDIDAASEEILELIDKRFDAAKHLLETQDPDFIQVTTFYLNSLHHFLWDDEKTLEAWQLIDQHICELQQDSYNVVLMSDHGSNPIKTSFYINTWLENEGYLTLDTTFSDVLYKLGVDIHTVEQLAIKLGLRSLVNYLPKPVINLIKRIPDDEGGVDQQGKSGIIDWDETTAIASGQGPIYISVPKSSSEYKRIRGELITKLSNLSDNQQNPIADEIIRGEEYYSGEYVDESPDLIIDQAEGVHIQGSVNKSVVFENINENDWIAENKKEGLFAATGPDFGQKRVDSLSILDLAPTLLHLYNCPVPNSLDGNVQKLIFSPTSDAIDRSPEYTDDKKYNTGNPESERAVESDVRDRLDDLGYLE